MAIRDLTEEYYQFCGSEIQEEYLKLYLESGNRPDERSSNIVAKKAKRSEGVVRRSLALIVANAAKQGYAPNCDINTPVPEGYKIRGTSTLYDDEGNKKIQWVKTDVDKERQEELMREWIEHLGETIEAYKPLKKIPAPKRANKDLLTVYPMGDPHIGMYSWCKETGEDFDCDIAERDLLAAMRYLVDKSPPSETAIILNLGDFFHTDSTNNTTTKGTRVDVDSRYSRVLRIGIELMISAVNMALEKHKKVIVRNNRGNHDSETSKILSIVLMYAYKNNSRVEIWPPEKEFFCYQFGGVMIASCHGDMVKIKDMPSLMATHFPKIWGGTIFRYAFQGHVHHKQVVENNGVVSKTYNTLAASDSWHFNSGYMSNRSMELEVYHKDLGMIESYMYSIPRDFSQL
ncbi:MAG: hypothetical protein GY861_03985 [bacterium]|nr:hypothetical protein [bacterium]